MSDKQGLRLVRGKLKIARKDGKKPVHVKALFIGPLALHHDIDKQGKQAKSYTVSFRSCGVSVGFSTDSRDDAVRLALCFLAVSDRWSEVVPPQDWDWSSPFQAPCWCPGAAQKALDLCRSLDEVDV